MSVKIWDSASQAFVEPQNVPRRYDAESGAFVDTTGKAYDVGAAAWAEKWSPNKPLYLYNEGDECVDITGGWKLKPYSGYESYTSVKKNASNMYFYLAYANYCGSLVTNNKIDVTGYSKLIFSGNFEFGTGAQTNYIPNVFLGVEYNSVPSSGYYGGGTLDNPTVSYGYKETIINKMILDLSDVTNNLLIPVIHGVCGVLKFTFEKILLE